jgi:peroxiredoxin
MNLIKYLQTLKTKIMKTTMTTPVISTVQKMIKLTLVVFALIVLNSCSSDDDNSSTTAPPTSGTTTTAPDFSLTSLDNKTVKLSDYSNKVVVLFFFGNECTSCKAAAPKVNSDLFTAYSSRTDYQILGLDQWNGNTAKVQGFKNTTSVGFPLLLNASVIVTSYKSTYDRLVVIDKSGKIVFNGTQGASSDISAAKAKVDELLK